MTLFIVKIAPKQRSIHEKSLGIVGELSLIRENSRQSTSLSSDINQRTVYHQTSTSAQSIVRQASHSLSSDNNQPTPITLSIHRSSSSSQAIQTNDQYKISSHRTDRAN